MAGHSSGLVHGQFCAKRKTPCDDGENHQKNCFPGGRNAARASNARIVPPSWAKLGFWEAGDKRGYEAHHLLCVASVTEVLIAKPSQGFKDIVFQTEWCINRPKNMIAMPLWGHTLMHYCVIEDKRLKLSTRLTKGMRAPTFALIPQHDYSHNLYIKEVKVELKKVIKVVKKAKHSEKSGTLAGELDAKSSYFRGELNRRGSSRNMGTHKSWIGALKERNLGDWHRPFSMANDGLEPHRHFPGTRAKSITADKIQAMVNAYLR